MAVAEESLSNIRTVRSFTGEEIEQARYGEALRKYSDINNRLGLSVGLFHGDSLRSLIIYSIVNRSIMESIQSHTIESSLYVA